MNRIIESKAFFLILLLLSTCGYGQNVKSFTNGSIQLFYEEYGKGPPLYILTGGPGESPDAPSYYQLIDSLKSMYTCVLLHQRGSGKSRNIPINEKTITIKNYTQDIELLRQERNDKKITLLGESWGGLLVMNYAVSYPQSVAKLVLICSAPPSYKVWNVLYDNQYVRHSQTALDSMDALQKIFSARTERELDSLKRADASRPEVVALKKFIAFHIRSMYYTRNPKPENFDNLFTNFNFQPIPIIDKEVLETKWDITEKLKKLNVPALIIYGRQDDQGESTFFLQQESLKNSEVHVIERCGHIIMEEQPVGFYKILLGSLKRKN